jgi:hypothetical protein
MSTSCFQISQIRRCGLDTVPTNGAFRFLRDDLLKNPKNDKPKTYFIATSTRLIIGVKGKVLTLYKITSKIKEYALVSELLAHLPTCNVS